MDQPLTHENTSTAAAHRDSNVSMDIAGETALDRLFKHFETSLSGLDTEEAKRRLRHYGPNQPVISCQPTLVAQVFNRIDNPLVIALLIASALPALAGDAVSFIIVVIIVTISVSMDYLQERRAQNTIEASRETLALRARTIRDGKETLVSTLELVPSDIRVGDQDGEVFCTRHEKYKVPNDNELRSRRHKRKFQEVGTEDYDDYTYNSRNEYRLKSLKQADASDVLIVALLNAGLQNKSTHVVGSA